MIALSPKGREWLFISSIKVSRNTKFNIDFNKKRIKMGRKKVIAWIYQEDKEVLKQMKGSIAEAVNSLLHSKDETLESYAENYFNPKIEQIKETLREALSVEIERRFKELGSK